MWRQARRHEEVPRHRRRRRRPRHRRARGLRRHRRARARPNTPVQSATPTPDQSRPDDDGPAVAATARRRTATAAAAPARPRPRPTTPARPSDARGPDRDHRGPARGLEDALYELKRVIVGQDAMLERLLVALLAGGHVLLEGVPGLAKTLTVKTLARGARRAVPARAVHAGPRAVRPRRHAHLPAGHGPLRHRARPGLRQLPARRRDQPRARQGAERAARGHAGAPGDDRGRDLPAAASRSSCSPRRTRSSPRAPTRCPRPRSTASCSS